MILIASADNNWGIGNKGSLLVRISNDMKNFRRLTTGNVIVLGRKTLETFPNGLPLAQRTNIILTHNEDFKAKDAVIVHNLKELFKELSYYKKDEIFIVGGESVYNLLAPYCDKAIITKIDYKYQADAHIPNFDELPNWEMVEESEEETCFDIIYTYRTYVNHKPLPMEIQQGE